MDDAARRARRRSLNDAEAQAVALFRCIEERNIIQPGRTEREVNEDIHALAAEFGTTTHWHKRIVRAGRNTLCPYDDNPPDLVIQDDDLVFVDLGPVFDDWEADFGRTYVIGDDPVKRQLVTDVESAFAVGRRFMRDHSQASGADVYAFMEDVARSRGWELGQWHTGHLIGDFPHARPPEKVHNFLMPGNDQPLHGLREDGQPLEWILEVHFVDPHRGIGAFFEQLA